MDSPLSINYEDPFIYHVQSSMLEHRSLLKTKYIIVRVSKRTYLAARCYLCLLCNALFVIQGQRIRGPDRVSFKRAVVYLLRVCAAVQTYGACTNRSGIMSENVL